MIYRELCRRLEVVKSRLMTLYFKSHLLKRHKEVIDISQKYLVIVSKYNQY
jgi:hypothetical protein